MDVARLKGIWIILLMIAIGFPATGQVYTPFFKNLKTAQGLSHNKVNRVMEDLRGFIWIGTEDGLNRYDGRYFKVFRRSEDGKGGIGGNIINDIYEDKQGVIWIGTADGGLTKYDYRLSPDKQFKQYRFTPGKADGIPENNILRIAESHGALWLATSKSYVVRFNKVTEKFDSPVKKGTRAILSLKLIAQDTLLVGRAGGGTLWINTRNLSAGQDERYMDLYSSHPHASITGMYRDRKTHLWVSSWDNRLYVYTSADVAHGRVGKVIDVPGAVNDEVTPYAEDRYGQLWMGSKNSGLTIADRAGKFHNYRFNPFKDGTVASDKVNHVFISRGGIVWVATDNGLSMYNPLFSSFEQYTFPRLPKDIIVNDFYRDLADNLWVATSEGLYLKRPGNTNFEHRKLSYKGLKLNITKFFIDRDGTFYLGTDYTLFVYDPLQNGISVLPNTEKDPVMRKLISSRIVSIVRDTVGDHPALIVSPYGHYFTYYDFTEKRWVSRLDKKASIIERLDIRDNLIQKFAKTESGEVWIATKKSGLGEWDGGKDSQIKYFGADENNRGSLRTSHVFDIVQDAGNGFWISTYGGGLNYFDAHTRKFSHVYESSNLTEGMEKDRKGNLWMIANGHIHRFEPATKIYSCYDLPGLEKNGGLKGYVYRDAASRLYAGAVNTFIVFEPSKIARIADEPDIFLTDFQIFNTSYSHYLHQKAIHLDYKQNYFSIEFSAPDYSGDNVVYSYQLEGLDKNWIQAGKRNFATYANLPGGRYVFKVRATNWQTQRIQHYASIIIIIKPPFWMMWWFYVLLFIALAILGMLIYYYRVAEIIKRQAIRNGIAQDLHDSVGSTLSSILVYTEVAKNHQQNERPAQLSSVLGSIELVSTEMISEMADIVWAINPRNDHLHGIIDRIKAYGMPLCEARNIHFQVIADAKILLLALDMKVRKNLYLILKESLNNAVKYAECKHIVLKIVLTGKDIHFTLSDDGKGFCQLSVNDQSSRSLSGNGLENLRNRAEELSAKLEINSLPGQGTTISLIFQVALSNLTIY
jgi:signal transduction histidine kinase/ligand-binding sensor domain-containing protein